MQKRSLMLSLGLCALSTLFLASAQSTTIKLFGPNNGFTTAQGTVTFPFGYYNIDAASGRKMYDDPIVQDYYAALKTVSEEAGYERSCLSRQIYLLKGSVSSLKSQEATWIKMMQAKPNFYRLEGTVKYPSFTAKGETISGTVYAFNTDDGTKYGDGMTVYGFFLYPKTGVTWVMECGSGK